MEVINDRTEILLAQISDGHLQLGGLFDKLKVNIEKYENVIETFKTFDSTKTMFLWKNGELNWDAIAEAIEGCDDLALSYFKTLDDGNGKINNTSASIEGMSEYLKKSGQAFDFAAIKATLMNTALNAGPFLLASFVIQGMANALDHYIHRTEIARARTDEISSAFKQTNDTLAAHKKTASELADRYDELSKGINRSTNSNVSLSTEEYEEFLDINEKLADSFPELAKGIDDNGNSILTLGTKGITAKEQLKELLQAEGLMASDDAQQIMEYMLAKYAAGGGTIGVDDTIFELAKEYNWLADMIDQWGLYYNASKKGYGNTSGSKNLGVGNYTPAAVANPKKNEQIELPKSPNLPSTGNRGAAKSAKTETDALSGLNTEMDKLQSAYKSLCDIRDTYNRSGKITVDQYQALTNMGFTFLSQLVDENGQLGLNASAFERLSQAKLEEMQIQMVRISSCKIQKDGI